MKSGFFLLFKFFLIPVCLCVGLIKFFQLFCFMDVGKKTDIRAVGIAAESVKIQIQIVCKEIFLS